MQIKASKFKRLSAYLIINLEVNGSKESWGKLIKFRIDNCGSTLGASEMMKKYNKLDQSTLSNRSVKSKNKHCIRKYNWKGKKRRSLWKFAAQSREPLSIEEVSNDDIKQLDILDKTNFQIYLFSIMVNFSIVFHFIYSRLHSMWKQNHGDLMSRPIVINIEF